MIGLLAAKEAIELLTVTELEDRLGRTLSDCEAAAITAAATIAVTDVFPMMRDREASR